MTTESITSCPICENDHFIVLLRTKDYTVTGEEFEIRKCKSCQFILTSPRPSSATIGKYYASDKYISHSGTSLTLFDKVYLSARNITLKWKHHLINKYSSTPSSILDYGCGTGEFLNFQKKKGWDVTGVEPSEIARAKANILLGNKVYEHSDLLEKKSFNIITLWHVLEHVHELNPTIQKLKDLLSPEGHLIIAVPNPNSHDCHHYKNHWAGYDTPRHLWHFSQDTMKLLMKLNGLTIVETSPMKLDSYYVSLLSEGYKNPAQSKLESGIKAIIEGLKSNLAARKNNEYSSLIYVVKPV